MPQVFTGNFEDDVRAGAYNTKLDYALDRNAARDDQNKLHQKFMDDLINFFLNSGVPAQYLAKCASKAWSDGHAHGHSEVLNCSYSIIEIFN